MTESWLGGFRLDCAETSVQEPMRGSVRDSSARASRQGLRPASGKTVSEREQRECNESDYPPVARQAFGCLRENAIGIRLASILYDMMVSCMCAVSGSPGWSLPPSLRFFPSLFTPSGIWRPQPASRAARRKPSGRSLLSRFHSPFVDRVVLVVQGLPPADSAEGEQALATIVDGTEGGTRRLRLWSLTSSCAIPSSLGKGGGTFVLVGLSSTEGPVESLVPKLHDAGERSCKSTASPIPRGEARTDGRDSTEFRHSQSQRGRRATRRKPGHSSDAALLLVAFGSLVAALIPLAVGQLAIATTLAITGLLAQRLHLSILVQNLATMLGLGLGIDYALLMVSRFREAISAGHDGSAASVIAARQAGRTLLISASTVAIGFLALLTVPISEIRSIGVAGFLVAGISVLLTNTLVPAVLALLGPRIDAGRMPFTPKSGCRPAKRERGIAGGSGATVIVARPWLALMPGRHSFASAGLAGHAAGYQPPQGRLASAVGGIGRMRFTRWNKWTGPALFNRCA